MLLIKTLGGFLVLMSLGLCTVQAQEMDAMEEFFIKAQIKELVDRYAIARDNLDAQEYANTFAEDGALVIGGNAVQGRDVIAARVEAANPNSIGMHIMSTSQITVIDAENATGIHYATVYGATADDSHEAGSVIAVPGFVAQGKYFDKYELTEEGWKIAERRFERVYSLSE